MKEKSIDMKTLDARVHVDVFHSPDSVIQQLAGAANEVRASHRNSFTMQRPTQ